MNFAKSSIDKSVVTWSLSLVLIVAGWISFGTLPRLEDPEFTIKEALVMTPYPGASAEEVAEEVSDIIEHPRTRTNLPECSRGCGRPTSRVALGRGCLC